jgi:low temperature requirement protein LtrA
MRLALRKDLFRPPKLRVVTEEDRERHATWMELFGDLAVVAVISQLGSVLKHDYSGSGLVTYFVLFLPVWWSWVGNTFYLSRFDSDDLLHRLFGLVQIALVASLAMSIPSAAEGHYVAYVASYVALRLLLIFQYFFAGRHNPNVRQLTNSYIAGFGGAVLLWVISLFVPQPMVMPLWGAAILIDFSIPVVARSLHVKFPPNASHLPERFGLFTIIVLGEAVLSAVVGAISTEIMTIDRLIAAIALIISFAIWWLYFEGVSASEIRLPTDRASATRYQLWMFSHLPLHMAIVAGAVGTERAMHVKPGEPFYGPDGFILASVSFVVMLCMHLLFNAALPKEAAKQAVALSWPHYILTGLSGLLIFVADRFSALALVSVLAGIFVLHVLLTLRDRAPRIPKRDVDISDYMAWWDGG